MSDIYIQRIFGLKRSEILTHGTTWVNLEDLMLSEMLYGFTYMRLSRTVKFIEM